MEQKRAVIAVDVGGTKTACGLFLEQGQLLYERIVPTCQESAGASVAQLANIVEGAVAQAPRDVAAAAVGIIVPGWINRRERTVWAPNIKGWDHFPLEQMLAERVPLPLVLDSDRSGYVKGETWLGVARALKDVVFLAVGTGIGAGILANGEVLHGHNDLAGAVGWCALNPRFQELYVRMGCFEAEASGNSLGRKGAEKLAGKPGILMPSVSARDVIQAAVSGEPAAKELLDEAVLYLGMGIANLVSTLDPEMVVLGGGLFQNGSFLLDRVRLEFVRWAQPIAAHRVRIELSALGERAGLAGAARIAFDNV